MPTVGRSSSIIYSKLKNVPYCIIAKTCWYKTLCSWWEGIKSWHLNSLLLNYSYSTLQIQNFKLHFLFLNCPQYSRFLKLRQLFWRRRGGGSRRQGISISRSMPTYFRASAWLYLKRQETGMTAAHRGENEHNHPLTSVGAEKGTHIQWHPAAPHSPRPPTPAQCVLGRCPTCFGSYLQSDNTRALVYDNSGLRDGASDWDVYSATGLN